MASTPLMVLTGNAVITWDSLNEPEDPFTFYPHSVFSIADVAWNHNGQVLASCSAVSTDEQVHNNVVLTAAKSGNILDSLQHNHQWKRPAGATTSLAFGGKSRYLCIGDTSGAVCLWDLKKKLRVRQFFHDKEASRQVSLDPTDTYVMSLTSRALRSYKLRDGIPAATWVVQSNYSFTHYSSSTLEPHFAAIGTDDGSLLLYDITNLQKSAPFLDLRRYHDGPITGVAFSYMNDKLLASTSTDGALKFFDKGSGTLIQELVKLPNGISGLTLNVDGTSCAVGTITGEVAVYDLRQTGAPLASMHVQGHVKCLRFSPPPKQKNTPNATTPATVNKASYSSQEQKEMEDLRRDLDQATSLNAPLPNYQYQEPPTQEAQKQSSPFSSLQHPINMQSPSFVSKDPQISVAEATEDSPKTSTNNSYPLTNIIPRSPPTSHAQHGESSGTFSLQGIQSVGSKQPTVIASENVPTSPPPTPKGTDYSGLQREDTPEKGGGIDRKSYLAPPSTTQSLNAEEIRDVVRDEVEKLQDDLEESLRNLHMDMIRQFHLQSQELNNALSSQLAAMDQLREENQRLREENDFLKRHHQKQNSPPGQRKFQSNNRTMFDISG